VPGQPIAQQGQQAGTVTQARTVIVPEDHFVRCRADRCQRLVEHAVSPAPVAQQGERGRDLALGQRRGEFADLDGVATA
jgi:hypothetical protein